VEDTGFEVRTTDRSFLDRIRPHLAGHETTEEALAGLASYLFSAISGEDRTLPGGTVARGFHSLYAQGMRIYHGLDPEAMAGSLLHMMRSLALDYLDEFVRIRGGALAVQGDGVLLPTPQTRPELPSLVAALVSRGAAYLSEEVALIDPVRRRLHPSPLPLLLDPSDVSRFPGVAQAAPPRGSRRASRGRYAVPAEAFGVRTNDPVHVGWIVYLSFEPGAETRLEPSGGAWSLFGLSQSCANLDVWEGRGLALFRELVETAATSRLVIGSLEEAADLVMETAPSLVGT
jgi:hypothetical protein